MSSPNVVETTLPHMPRLPLGSSEGLAAIAHTKHQLLPRGPVKLADLARLKLILPTARFGLRNLFDDAARARELRIRPFMEINALPMAVSLLHRLPVCTVLPASAVKSVRFRYTISKGASKMTKSTCGVH